MAPSAVLKATLPACSSVTIPEQLRTAAVGTIMTRGVICVSPRWTLAELLVVLVDGNMGGVPVVDDAWRAIGIISKSDVARYLLEHGNVDTGTVANCMLPMAMTVSPEMPIARVAALMAWEGIHRLPVCGPAGDVVGIVSSLDIVRWLARVSGELSLG